MAGESSFDVVSDFDQQELVNALDQVRREIATRYDFKGSRSTLELGKAEVTLTADDEFRAKAVRDLVESKAVRRGLSLKIFEWGKLEPASGGTVRQRIELKRGLTSEQRLALAHEIRARRERAPPDVWPHRAYGLRGLEPTKRAPATLTGSSTKKRVPTGRLSSTRMRPPCSSRMCRTIARPRPVPRPLVEK